jgi:hypothetical protein
LPAVLIFGRTKSTDGGGTDRSSSPRAIAKDGKCTDARILNLKPQSGAFYFAPSRHSRNFGAGFMP